MARWEQMLLVLALLVVAVTNSAPVEEINKETPASELLTKETETLGVESKYPVQIEDVEEEKTSQETKEGAIAKESPEEVEGSGVSSEEEKEEVVTPNKEIVDYRDIEVDDGSDVINENNEVSYAAGLFDDNFDDYRLDEQEARELLRELSDPAQVALFIMESDDVTGFLKAVGMLLEQRFISEEYAFFVKEAVSQELEELLMLQDQELFGNPMGLQNPVDPDYVEEILNRPAPYNPQDYMDYPMPYEETYPESVDYEMFQKPYSEETIALSEIANIVADQIENGEMSTDRGERIIDILSQLLPESFWNEGEISEEMMQEMGQDFSNLYPSMPIGDGYQTFEDEEDEPLPGGNRHVKEEVVVDKEGRPVAEVLQTIEEQETGDVLDGEDAKEAEEELEKELEEIEPEEQDDFEQALQDVEAIATAEEESKDDLDDEMVDAADDNSAWKDLVLLLDEGKVSDELLKELGIFNKDLDLRGELD
ncbi:uncharacterized protein LOC117287803 [Asterias rubens]|uniref:uncharacterized protein LOC117287803 n=1 Tax=Asterias rubens TaxID=7604 RepID=UPI001455D87D|nr:uncharacterized protein LOC117287803 [Asterias rubens]